MHALKAGLTEAALFELVRNGRRYLTDLFKVPKILHQTRLDITDQITGQFNNVARDIAQLRDRIEQLSESLEAAASSDTDPDRSEERQDGTIELKPLSDIPYGSVDLNGSDPILAIIDAPEYPITTKFFEDNPAAQRSLVSPEAQALLYSLIRMLKPQRVVEIGTFRAATTEAIARALHANTTGVLDTIDPFGKRTVRPILAAWPEELRKTTVFHAVNSMQFFAEMERLQQRAELIFVDGNHDFEFALFDIKSAARFLTPGGFIVIDNISQPGPYMASRDFLARHRGWKECGKSVGRLRQPAPYDMDRTKISNTDFCVLRAPSSIIVGSRPMTPGISAFTNKLSGLQVELAQLADGILHVQCVVRTFGGQLTKSIVEKTVDIRGDQVLIQIPLEVPESAPDVRRTVEPWLSWKGDKELQLSAPPRIF